MAAEAAAAAEDEANPCRTPLPTAVLASAWCVLGSGVVLGEVVFGAFFLGIGFCFTAGALARLATVDFVVDSSRVGRDRFEVASFFFLLDWVLSRGFMTVPFLCCMSKEHVSGQRHTATLMYKCKKNEFRRWSHVPLCAVSSEYHHRLRRLRRNKVPSFPFRRAFANQNS